MKNMLTRDDFELILSRLKEHPNPKYHLEQYSITPGVATRILFLAKDDIENKVVYDLGCGTGRFAIGAALLGAKVVYGVDIDKEAIDAAKENAKIIENYTHYPIVKKCKWVTKDIKKLKAEADTVIQFPPFTLDKMFFEKALEIGKNVYSIQRATPETEKKLKKICRKFKAKIVKTEKFPYHIPWREGSKSGYVILLVVAKK
jgi:putative methylase